WVYNKNNSKLHYIPMSHHAGTITLKKENNENNEKKENKIIKFGVFGHMFQNKRIEQIINAFKISLTTVKNIHLYLVGKQYPYEISKLTPLNILCQAIPQITIYDYIDINKFNNIIS